MLSVRFRGYTDGTVNIWSFCIPCKPSALSEHDFRMKCERDELLLAGIDDGPRDLTLYSTDSVVSQTLLNHTCTIKMLCYNEAGSILASGCQRGLVYVNFLSVCLYLCDVW